MLIFDNITDRAGCGNDFALIKVVQLTFWSGVRETSAVHVPQERGLDLAEWRHVKFSLGVAICLHFTTMVTRIVAGWSR